MRNENMIGSPKVTEPNLAHIAYDLLHSSTALTGILEFVEGDVIIMPHAMVIELISKINSAALSAAEQLNFIHTERDLEKARI